MWEPGSRVILFLGRLVEQKEPAVLLEAVRLLSNDAMPIVTLFAGEGPLRPALEERAKELALGSRVRFLGNRNDADRLLAAADVLAMPSRFEGLPLAALEAMSAGLPIVGCDAPGVRDAVQHDITGWLAPVGDAATLALGLQRALGKPGRRWSAASRHRYEQEFTATQMATRFDHHYRAALAGRSGVAGLRRAA
jgi:glycosyltransferase involved in cell wall biosynthesis